MNSIINCILYKEMHYHKQNDNWIFIECLFYLGIIISLGFEFIFSEENNMDGFFKLSSLFALCSDRNVFDDQWLDQMTLYTLLA